MSIPQKIGWQLKYCYIYIYIYVHLIPTFFELMKVPIRISLSLSLMKIPVKQCLLFLSQNCGWLQIYTNLYTSYQFFSYLPLFQSHETLRISARPSRPSQHTPLVSGLGESGPYQGGLALHIVPRRLPPFLEPDPHLGCSKLWFWWEK